MLADIKGGGPIPVAAHYDVCIAGAGVAGITLAKSLGDRGKRVLLLEGGGAEVSEESQDIYKGDIIGHEYFPLDVARLRMFGGTSNHWGGWSRPLDPLDFEGRPYIAGSAWPIGYSELQPYLSAAQEILDLDSITQDGPPLTSSQNKLKQVFWSYSGPPPVSMGERYGALLRGSKSIDVLLHANLIDVHVNGKRVTSFVFRDLYDGTQRYEASADNYVLALGGIENARIMLNVTDQNKDGLGNEHDLVGRFFMEHPTFDVGCYFLTATDQVDTREDRAFIAPTKAFALEAELAGCTMILEKLVQPNTQLRAPKSRRRAQRVRSRAECAEDILGEVTSCLRPDYPCKPLGIGVLRVTAEQPPDPASRVTLTSDKDRLGLRRPALAWVISPLVKQTIRVCALEFAKYLARSQTGLAKLQDWVLEEDAEFPSYESGAQLAGYHHIGTTRMGFSARDGVVDRDCRVFGLDNLYVAGSSVFRSGGYANPTLTLVQLALRLSDHLARD